MVLIWLRDFSMAWSSFLMCWLVGLSWSEFQNLLAYWVSAQIYSSRAMISLSIVSLLTGQFSSVMDFSEILLIISLIRFFDCSLRFLSQFCRSLMSSFIFLDATLSNSGALMAELSRAAGDCTSLWILFPSAFERKGYSASFLFLLGLFFLRQRGTSSGIGSSQYFSVQLCIQRAIIQLSHYSFKGVHTQTHQKISIKTSILSVIHIIYLFVAWIASDLNCIEIVNNRKMLRKVHTSQNQRRFLHEKLHLQDKSNNITRPPTSHPYSALRNIRSQDTLHQKYAFVNKSSYEREPENREQKTLKESQFAAQPKIKESSMPKVYLHLLTEIRILFRCRQKEQQKTVDNLIANLSKRISELHLENEQHRRSCSQNEQQIIRLQQVNDELVKKNRKFEANNSTNSRSITKPTSKGGDLQLLMENIKLSQLNSAYLSKINDLQQSQKQKFVQVKKEIHENESTEILRYHNRISYLEMKLKNSEDKEGQLVRQVEKLQRVQLQLEDRIKQITQQINNLQQKLSQWRERAQMQFQDSEMHLTRQNYLLFSIKKLRELNKSLTQKLINQSNSEGHVYKQEVEPNPYFHYEIDFFKNIRSVYFDSKYKQFKLNSKKSENIELTNFELEEEYLEYRKYEEINLTQLTYYVPSFYSFIEESITNQIANTRIKGNGSVSRVFIQILRSIFNSKFNQFLMFSEEKYTKFPEFVYTWFQKFYFNSQKNDIASLQPYMQKPFPQDLFYRDLMNIKLDQSWQIITFREFLMQQLNLQELYFYLMCQNLLFRRGSITKAKQYQGDFCILVQYNAAKLVLDMVLSDFQSWNLGYLTSKMRQKIIYRKNVEYIESGFFLRCLVEYYKIERINRFKYIAKLCKEFKSQEKGLRFSSFVSVINRFTQVSIQQKIILYRQCYCLGKGRITADIIFTVCSEKLVFLKYLKLKCFYKLPLLTTQRSMRNMQLTLSKKSSHMVVQDKKPIICLQPSEPYLYNIYIKMLNLLKADSAFCSQSEKLGLIDLVNNITHLQKIFNDKLSSTDSSVLRCKHFMHFLNEAINKIKIINFNNFYELLEEENKKKNSESFWIDINQSEICTILAEEFNTTLKIYDKLTQYVAWKNKVYEFRLHHAARKIQRMVRKKFIAPFIQLYKIIYSQKGKV